MFCLFGVHQYVHKQIAKAAGLVSPDEKLTAILRSLQQTAVVTFSSQKMVHSLESKVTTMKLNIHKMQTNIRRMKHDRPPVLRNCNTSSADGLRLYSAALTDTPYHQLVDCVGCAHMPSSSQEIAMGLSGVVMSEQRLSADVTQAYSAAPVPAVSAASSSRLGQEGTSSPLFSPMKSPMMSALHTHPGHHGFHNEAPGSAVATTPQSLLSSSTPGASNLGMSKKREVETTVVSPVDVLDIRGLNARVDAMQSRLVYTIQQAKAAREKSRAVFARRRDPVSYALYIFAACARATCVYTHTRALTCTPAHARAYVCAHIHMRTPTPTSVLCLYLQPLPSLSVSLAHVCARVNRLPAPCHILHHNQIHTTNTQT